MGTIAFFPWARLQTPMVHQGRFSLIPFRTDTNPLPPDFAKEWDHVRSFISNYHDIHGKPVKEAAMLLIDAAPMSGGRQRNEELSGFKSTREVWLRDLYRLRNPYMHGRTKPRYNSVWTTEEHILLTSFIFPTLLKIRLQSLGQYALVDDDYRQIYYFDQLLALGDVFAEGKGGPTTYAWGDVIYNGRWAWLSERDDLMP